MEQLKVSIIIPNYNHKRFLKQRIDSVLSQTYPNFEVIILDDCSTDNSKNVIEQYKEHSKISHIIYNDINSGSPFKQWVKGIEKATGDLIWIAESDDFASPIFLEKTVSILDTYPDVSLVYSDSLEIDEFDNQKLSWSEKRNAYFNTTRWNNNYINDGVNEIFKFLLFSNTINNASAVLFRKHLIHQTNYKEKLVKYKNVGDLYTYIFLLSKGKIYYLNENLNYLRIHASNVTKINTKSGLLDKESIYLFSILNHIIDFNILISNKKDYIKSLKVILNKHVFNALRTSEKQCVFGYLKEISKTKILSINYFYSLNLFLNIYVFLGYKEFVKKQIRKIFFQ